MRSKLSEFIPIVALAAAITLAAAACGGNDEENTVTETGTATATAAPAARPAHLPSSLAHRHRRQQGPVFPPSRSTRRPHRRMRLSLGRSRLRRGSFWPTSWK